MTGEYEDLDIFGIIEKQSGKIGELLDYNQSIIKITRQQAENWRQLSRAYMECASMASEIADSCALIARISVDRAGDIISNEWGIEEIQDDDSDPDEEADD